MGPRTVKGSALLAALMAATVGLSACGGDSKDRDDRSDRGPGLAITGIDGRVSVIRPGQDANAAYSKGLDLKTQGDCPGAILKLRPVAGIGPGYENAQTALGTCLLQTGAKDKDLSSDYLEGLTWLRRAADAGWPEAQGALASAHAFGPSAIRNGEEAAYWFTLYQTNPSKSRIGFASMPVADEAAIDKSLSAAAKTAGAKRAAGWQRKVWLPPAPPGRDFDKSESERPPRGRERRGQPFTG